MRYEADSASLLRRTLLGLSAASIVAISIELAMGRHWDNLEQLIPWPALVVAAIALYLIASRPTSTRLRIARGLCVLLLLVALVGIWRHVTANYDAAPLDQRFSERWSTMSEWTRWWLAMTKGVGPSPPLAPGVLAQSALMLFAATLRHPALGPGVGQDGTR